MDFRNFGINAQALAVMAYLGNRDGIESSWNKEASNYMAEVRAAPFYNGRERGIVFYMTNARGKQLNIVVYEHRNTDQICAIRWEKNTYINPPNLNDLGEDVFPTSHSYTESWKYGEAHLAADWIYEEFNNYWDEGPAARS